MLRDPGVDRGVDNILRNCLRVARGERVALLHWKSPDLLALFDDALSRLGAIVTRVDLAGRSSVPPGASPTTISGLDGCAVSMLIAAQEFPMALSFAVRNSVQTAKTRHLHLGGLDLRVLAQSARAEPERLELIAARVCDAITSAGVISVASELGTSLEVRVSRAFPLITGAGRPEPGAGDNIPAGFVYWHPADVRGVFVADRGLALSGHRIVTRRAPVKLVIEGSRVREYECVDDEICAKIEAYFSANANASRVGTVVFPTNYLVRSEIGVHAQDELSPGLNINLGFTNASITRAPWDAAVQARLLARKLTVRAGDRSLVEAGRHTELLVEGVDPFR